MKILLCSVPFRPSVGGIETVTEVLADQFVQRGHRVRIVTLTADADSPSGPSATVLRRPDAAELWARCREADVVLHNQISLQLAWPVLALRRPWVIAHHTWTPRRGSGHIKHRLFGLATNVAVSRAMAASLDVPSVVLPNPYRADVFKPLAGVARDRELVFVGRLVSDKGVPVLLAALQQLKQRGVVLSASIVGQGPDEAALRVECQQRGLQSSVDFTGPLHGQALVTCLHRHRCTVVPSVWEEPFGLVALEALACGCVPVVSRSGGLPEAVGSCGVVVEKGDPAALAQALFDLHHDPAAAARLLVPAQAHLARHQPAPVADAYLRMLLDASQRHRTPLAA